MLEVVDDTAFAEDLNNFYCRFDVHDFGDECKNLAQILETKHDESIIITADEVRKCLNNINTKKATGPDGIGGGVLRECKVQLAPVLCELFLDSLDLHRVPVLWKTST